MFKIEIINHFIKKKNTKLDFISVCYCTNYNYEFILDKGSLIEG